MTRYAIEICDNAIFIQDRRSGLRGFYTDAGLYLHGDLRLTQAQAQGAIDAHLQLIFA